jgi:hypothetical protein
MTTTSLAIRRHDPAALAADLVANNLPGRRSKTAITKLRAQRRRNHEHTPPQPLTDRLTTWLLAMYRTEIRRRGGETAIMGGNKGDYEQPLAITDRRDGLALLHVEGWRYYSRTSPYRLASLSYLCGRENRHPWAVRVPGTITTVHEALAWITPAKVKDAFAAGRRVVRQGDVYAIETSQRRNGTGLDLLPASHRYNPTTRYLTHHPDDGRKHAPARLAFPFEIVMQRVYEMGRTNSRANGD